MQYLHEMICVRNDYVQSYLASAVSIATNVPLNMLSGFTVSVWQLSVSAEGNIGHKGIPYHVKQILENIREPVNHISNGFCHEKQLKFHIGVQEVEFRNRTCEALSVAKLSTMPRVNPTAIDAMPRATYTVM